MTHKDLPPISDRAIARIAERAAAVYAKNGWQWAVSPPGRDGKVEMSVPGAADIALDIRRRLAELEPGQQFNSGRLVVEWVVDEAGETDAVEVSLELGSLYTAPDEDEL